jgi:hypothetical protein
MRGDNRGGLIQVGIDGGGSSSSADRAAILRLLQPLETSPLFQQPASDDTSSFAIFQRQLQQSGDQQYASGLQRGVGDGSAMSDLEWQLLFAAASQPPAGGDDNDTLARLHRQLQQQATSGSTNTILTNLQRQRQQQTAPHYYQHQQGRAAPGSSSIDTEGSAMSDLRQLQRQFAATRQQHGGHYNDVLASNLPQWQLPQQTTLSFTQQQQGRVESASNATLTKLQQQLQRQSSNQPDDPTSNLQMHSLLANLLSGNRN